ncbi:unnamed protein product [Rhizoctonia solani]|uniref:Uncharacterized protein n=1 Tax=Rhizoctonia solani TaxID=456999 RepID=A0A8H3H8C4_9AGAM|nr:unnamed protein product [Rhizoctonia solani]
MHGTAKALIVAAVALQASANPVGLFRRQASSSSVPVTSALSSLSTSVAIPTTTQSAPIPEPTAPWFPFPGSNGTYYICSFPSSNTTTSSTESITSKGSTSTSATASTASVTLTDDALAPNEVTTSSVFPSATGSVPVTSFSGSVPTPTPTEFTVVGPSTTAVIECIAVPTGVHPHPPPPANDSSVPPTALPTFTSLLTSSIPTSSPLSSTVV